MATAENGNAADYFLDRHVRAGCGERLAFDDGARRLTYAGLRAESARVAAALAAHGIGRERRVCLILWDTVDFPALFWGCLFAGVLPVPVNTLLTAETLAYILRDSRAEAAFVAAPLLAGLAEALRGQPALRHVVAVGDGAPEGAIGLDAFLAAGGAPAPMVEASPDETAFWLYSSGSTGRPKGVRHVHASLRATAETYAAQVLGIAADDTVFSAAKLFHAYGLGNGMTFPMSVGAATVLLPGRPTPEAVLETMRRFRPSIFCGVPTLYAGLLARPDLGPGAGSDRLRRCISAGEALPAHIGTRWAERVGVDILDGIGSTEMLHIFISNRPGDVRYGTSGKPVPGYAARIVDEHDNDVADGAQGELLVRGPSAADGYWNQRDKSRRTFQGEWTRTGDVYTRDAEGYYRYGGRNDDMMKVSGVWVSPFEVEEALAAHPAVLEAAVVGRQDTDGLLKPRAFIVLRPDAAATAPERLHAELKALVQSRIEPWKYPRWVEIVPALPKTATGKIERYRLRDAPPVAPRG
jgi:4-hydroxybenzoate-CoA ligase